MASDASGSGYWFTNSNGAVTAFGATYWGSAPQVLNKPVVGMAEADASGHFTGSSYPSGSYGYDISNFQCGNFPPSPHTIGLVEVVGESYGGTNDCLGSEAAWAGGGLNLYVYLTYGQAASSGDPACASAASPSACNYGFGAGINAFEKAQAAGINTSVAWWLDVEPDTPGVPGWSSSQAANAAVVQGALDGLRSEGLNTVGIYASPGDWSGIVGDYAPAVPYWAADWDINPATTCNNVHSHLLRTALGPGPDRPVQLPELPLSGRRDEHGLRQRLRLLNRRDRVSMGARRSHRSGSCHQLHGVVVAEEPPPVTVDLPGGHGGVLGPELEPGPAEAPGHRQLGQQRGLDHAGVARHHHQLARVGRRHQVQAPRHPVDEPGPALPARGDGLVRDRCPSRGRRTGR